MGTVYVTQIPHRKEDGKWIHTVDVSPALEHGELKVLLPPGMNFYAAAPVVQQMRADLREFDPEVDALLPMGDPLVMAAAAALLGRRLERFTMLKWDRITRTYLKFNVELG